MTEPAERTLVALTQRQAATLIGSLLATMQETARYLSSYPTKDDPGPLDACCDAHRAFFEERLRERAALRERAEHVDRLIAELEPVADGSMAQLDPLAPVAGGLHVAWEIDADDGDVSPARAAADTWRGSFRRGGAQPAADDACVFVVSTDRGSVQVDLSDERYAHLFEN